MLETLVTPHIPVIRERNARPRTVMVQKLIRPQQQFCQDVQPRLILDKVQKYAFGVAKNCAQHEIGERYRQFCVGAGFQACADHDMTESARARVHGKGESPKLKWEPSQRPYSWWKSVPPPMTGT